MNICGGNSNPQKPNYSGVWSNKCCAEIKSSNGYSNNYEVPNAPMQETFDIFYHCINMSLGG